MRQVVRSRRAFPAGSRGVAGRRARTGFRRRAAVRLRTPGPRRTKGRRRSPPRRTARRGTAGPPYRRPARRRIPRASTMHRESLVLGIDNPVMRHLALPERDHLLDQVPAGRRWREDLAHPVGPDAQGAPSLAFGYAFASPARDVRAIHVARCELDVDLGEDPPAAGTAATARAPLERSYERRDVRLRIGVLAAGGRLLDERAMHDLHGGLVGKAREVLGRRKWARASGHRRKVSLSPLRVR